VDGTRVGLHTASIPHGGTGVLLHFAAVSSRQQEKQRRREERLARERAEQAAAARRKRLQLAAGGLAGIAVIAVVVVLATAGLGGGGNDEQEASAPEAADVTLPEQQIGDLQAAVRAAGCRVQNPKIEGAQHEDREFKAADYKTNPPASGNHNPDWYEDGVYEPGDVPRLGMQVHALEHGRIEVQYKPGTSSETVAQLEAFLAEQSDGYHMLLLENTTGMDAAVAATAWGHVLTCPEMNDKVFDALRTFRAEYIDKGPENVP
jgi:Protein of unknown function (DUF3105)